LIQLTRNGLTFSGSSADLRKLRAKFRRDHYLILPKLIELDLLQTILRRIESAPFLQVGFDGVASQSVINDPLTYGILFFLVNIPKFQCLVQRITGCRKIAEFKGRIYRLNPSTGESIVWHTDVCDHRMVTFSLNLTTEEYRGGALQIRERGSKKILHEVRNTGLGDALLMPVSTKLAHRVLPVEGDVPRTAMAGWFRWEKGKEDFHAAVRKKLEAAPGAQDSGTAEKAGFGHP
jgi:hypothetical protein